LGWAGPWRAISEKNEVWSLWQVPAAPYLQDSNRQPNVLPKLGRPSRTTYSLIINQILEAIRACFKFSMLGLYGITLALRSMTFSKAALPEVLAITLDEIQTLIRSYTYIHLNICTEVTIHTLP
jgi:hypothetical protein